MCMRAGAFEPRTGARVERAHLNRPETATRCVVETTTTQYSVHNGLTEVRPNGANEAPRGWRLVDFLLILMAGGPGADTEAQETRSRTWTAASRALPLRRARRRPRRARPRPPCRSRMPPPRPKPASAATTCAGPGNPASRARTTAGSAPRASARPRAAAGSPSPPSPGLSPSPSSRSPISDERRGGARRVELRRRAAPVRISTIYVGHQGKEVWLPTGTISGRRSRTTASSRPPTGPSSRRRPTPARTARWRSRSRSPPRSSPTSAAPTSRRATRFFWGQAGPRLTQSNLSVTYSCFQQAQPGSNSWSAVLSAAAQAAGGLANAGTVRVGLRRRVRRAPDRQRGDRRGSAAGRLAHVRRDADDRPELAARPDQRAGVVVHQSGGNAAFQYPWSLTVHVESWGCADPKPAGTH